MRRWTSCLPAIVILVSSAFGHWPSVKSLTCPVCNHTFKWESVWSGFVPPPRLDLKPNDTEKIWAVPFCPRCTFVIYSENTDPNEQSKCRAFVKSQEYQRIKERPSYHRLGRLYEHLGKGDHDIAMAFLRASWQEERSAAHYREDLDKCLFYLRRHLAQGVPAEKTDVSDDRARDETWHGMQLLVGEVLRLSGRHDEAVSHFRSLLSAKGFLASSYGDTVLFELELCANRDSKPHFCEESIRAERRNKWRLLRESGVDLNLQDESGQTALMQAVREKDSNSAVVLVNLGVDIDTVDESGRTALHYAIEEGEEELALLLIDKDADIHGVVLKHSLESFVGHTPLHMAASEGLTRVASRLIEKGARIDATGVFDRTPLHCAIQSEHEDVALLLIGKGADVHAIIGESGSHGVTGMTPLHLAARYGFVQATSLLLEKGAKVNAVDGYGRTAAHLAIRYNRPQVLELLVTHGADIHLKDRQGDTLLRAVARQRNVNRAVAQCLIDLGSVVTPTIQSLLGTGRTQLQAAVEADDISRIVALTREECFGEQINLRCYHLPNSPTPLATAVSKGYTEAARLLIREGANVHETVSADQSLLFHAARANNTGIAQALIDGGADVNQGDMFEETPLHQAAWLGHTQMVQLLLKNGANVNAVMRTKGMGGNNAGFTPLHNAALGRKPEVVKLLIAHGAGVNAEDARGLTPLDQAVVQRDAATIGILEAAGGRRQGQRGVPRETSSSPSIPLEGQ